MNLGPLQGAGSRGWLGVENKDGIGIEGARCGSVAGGGCVIGDAAMAVAAATPCNGGG